jgi:hypothetical protein
LKLHSTANYHAITLVITILDALLEDVPTIPEV